MKFRLKILRLPVALLLLSLFFGNVVAKTNASYEFLKQNHLSSKQKEDTTTKSENPVPCEQDEKEKEKERDREFEDDTDDNICGRMLVATLFFEDSQHHPPHSIGTNHFLLASDHDAIQFEVPLFLASHSFRI
jgi:hypothetical protein